MIELIKQNKELWDLFTKLEEYNSPLLDRYDRFPYYFSQYKSISIPYVSEFLKKNGVKIEYPGKRNFAVCLTHDIDSINLPDMTKLLKNGNIKSAFKKSLYALHKEYNPLLNFNKIIELEEKFGAKSSFYFLVLDKNDLDFNYKIEDLQQELRYIVEKGGEVGLHGGHTAYNNLDEIIKTKKKLEKVLGKEVIGYRNHFLKFKTPDTWELLSKAGFKYDTTFGYADCVGFRNGMCHPFKPFNLNTNKVIDILEIPLSIMDCTLFDYMKLDAKGAWEITKLLIDIVEKNNGIITILWHNTYMFNDNYEFYKKILQYCNEKKAWMTSGAEIYKWILQ